MPYIRVKTGPNKGRIFEVKDQVITVGRDEISTIQILDQGVSRQHSEIFRIGEMCFVRDLNSTNGTFVNNLKVQEEVLKANDELLIGTTILVFEDKASAEAVVPSPTAPAVPQAVSQQAATPSGEKSVEIEGVPSEDKMPNTTTVELAVDKEKPAQKALGREVSSKNLTVLYELGKIIRSSKDFGGVLHKTVAALTEAVGANHGYLFLADHGTGKLSPKVTIEKEGAGEKKVSKTIVKRVLATGMPLLTTDATLDDRFALSESIVLKKIKSVICAPVMLGEHAEGLLYFHSARLSESFKVEDLELVSAGALHLAMAVASHNAGEKIRKGLISTIRALVTAMEIVDPKNQGHAQRVADYSAAIGKQMGLPLEEINRIRLAALLHDIGKLAVHHSVVGVTKESMKEQHVYQGEKILSQIEGFEDILPGLRYHHERADGSGFPYHIKNEGTPVMARIILVANSFDNQCTWGGIGGGVPVKDVLKDMAQRGGKEFDDEVIKALLLCHRSGTLYGS
ncbi:MAG: FHA domain-containing protein [Planctomycetes bacterium]|nr:FHA domain-containing protein [Planctomycetota bacterium]